MDQAALEAFIALERTGSFTQAARLLNLSQPGFSRRISAFEEEIGTPVVERRRGRAVLTEAGRAILPLSEAALSNLQDILAAVHAIKQGSTLALTLAISGAMCQPRLLGALYQYGRDRNFRLSLRAGSSSVISELVQRREATLGLRYGDVSYPHLISTPIGVQTMVVICSPTHRLLGVSRITPEDLEEETWIGSPTALNEADGGLRKTVSRLGLRSMSVMPVSDITAQKNLIEGGFGIGLNPRDNVEKEIRAGRLAILPVGDISVEEPVTILSRKGGYMDETALGLIEHVKRFFARRDAS
ncbi:LysR family transcriptional regulator [Sphingobium subterraneum]|uniref:Molybdate transport repressor ModE-like protein n=1 Tax=Sphingobium subterraneum TaxID=627688 RepID=A0A841IXH3_9SPHN|nr:LysR family transcriptional regulator [Sphingobium subterraneum]MBB6123363.1 molybdate transport repressor ModE-like protein [Sphingobium subterraneum]